MRICPHCGMTQVFFDDQEPGEIFCLYCGPIQKRHYQVSPKLAAMICKAKDRGLSYREIAAMTKYSHTTIACIIKRNNGGNGERKKKNSACI